ncbi:MAG: DegV family protein [Oscillospiraceae bacterium]|nr:DegV family protein [Oscillospiraceae bacterium]
MNYRIITDSACDLPENKVQNWLTRIPLYINLGEKTITDEEGLSSETLLNEISVSSVGPKSSCPAPGVFADSYEGLEDDLYVVTLSKEISGTYNSALQGKEIYLEENPGKNIHVFNSKTACAGQVLICEKIKELAESGLPFAEVVAQGEAFIEDAGTMFVLEDLEILRKSGRMSALQAAVTNTLKLKLVMGGTKEGTIAKVTQALSMTQALNKMVHIISEHAQKTSKGEIPMLVITHCFAKERADYIINKLKETCDIAEALICKAGGIGTMYANRGGVVVSYS